MAMLSSLVFTVQRREPVLVRPAEPTPHELKPLSDIDDQQALRFHISGIHFYRGSPSMAGHDPARVLREALAKALVFYYPLAGRLREGHGRKLSVECTGEGVVFVEADADFRLEQLGDEPQPPFPCLEELIYGVENYGGGGGFLTSPLLFIQVTRLTCGGFVLAHNSNHTVMDAAGMVQFLQAVAEMTRGASSPTVPPVWARELLMARDPPRVTHSHPEYDELTVDDDVDNSHMTMTMMLRSFFFGPREMSALRQHLPPHLHGSTRFEVLTACLWRSRTVALGTGPDEEVRLRFILNARGPALPAGFYGNAIVYPVARSTAGELCSNPLAYAVELLRAAKASVTDDYLQSVADLMVLRGRPLYTLARTYRVSDLTRLGFDKVDLGWGYSPYSGPAVAGGRVVARGGSNYIRFRNKKGEDGILVPVSLPAPAMERFAVEVERMTKDTPTVNTNESACYNTTTSSTTPPPSHSIAGA